MAGKGMWAKIGVTMPEGSRAASNRLLSAATQSYNRVIADGGSADAGKMAARSTARGLGHGFDGRDKAMGAKAHSRFAKVNAASQAAAKPSKTVDLSEQFGAFRDQRREGVRKSVAEMSREQLERKAYTVANRDERRTTDGVRMVWNAGGMTPVKSLSADRLREKVLAGMLSEESRSAHAEFTARARGFDSLKSYKEAQPKAAPKAPIAPVAETNTARVREDFAERREARADRLESRAARAAGEAQGRYAAMKNIQRGIPMGQPVLRGHHSAKRHMADIRRMDNHMAKSVAEHRKAEALTRRADAARKNRAISSDDPAAVKQLRSKLGELESLQKTMVDANKAIRAAQSKGKDPIPVLVSMGHPLSRAQKLVEKDFAGRIGFPDYATKNNGAEIRRVKQRIEALQQARSAPAMPEKSINGVKIDEGGNRVRMSFGGKPPDNVRAYLKGHGFKRAPSEGVWQRMVSNSAHYHAEAAAKMMGEGK